MSLSSIHKGQLIARTILSRDLECNIFEKCSTSHCMVLTSLFPIWMLCPCHWLKSIQVDYRGTINSFILGILVCPFNYLNSFEFSVGNIVLKPYPAGFFSFQPQKVREIEARMSSEIYNKCIRIGDPKEFKVSRKIKWPGPRRVSESSQRAEWEKGRRNTEVSKNGDIVYMREMAKWKKFIRRFLYICRLYILRNYRKGSKHF